MDYFSSRYFLGFCFQVVLALKAQACQPSNFAQDFPKPEFLMKPCSRIQILFLSLTAIFLLVGCGESKTEKTTSAKPTQASAPESKPIPAKDKMAIPFDIAMQAALNGHEDTVTQALETGTDPNQTDEDGRTMLMVSAFNGHTATVDRLLKAGTKVDTQDLLGRTALMYASTGTQIPTIELLLDHKAKVNLVDGEEHWSALMFAAAEGNMDVVKLLMQHAADNSLVDIDGESAELFARNNGHIAVADFLKSQAESQPK
jgi:uncharacterized protein